MSSGSRNTQMFAMADEPPAHLSAAGGCYALRRVFKHDFFAATCLYERRSGFGPERIVVKFGRRQGFMGLPMAWLGRAAADKEQAIYHQLSGLSGVPRWVGRLDETTYAIEHLQAVPLDHLPRVPRGFFTDLVALIEAVHSRGVAYADANKRSNILVGPDSKPYLVDFQISLRLREDLPWPLSAMYRRAVAFFAGRDFYYIFKHKRRLAPDELTERENAISRRRGLLHGMHHWLIQPWRKLRRRFLHWQHTSGRLVSPTARLEDHYQPEKATWRTGEPSAERRRA